LVERVLRLAGDPAFGAGLAAEPVREFVEREVERPVVPDARGAFDLPAAAERLAAPDLPVAERDVAAERALVERDAVDRPVAPERADPDFAVEPEARDVVDLLAGFDRAAAPDERGLAVLRPDVLRLDVLREPELDVVFFFLAVPVEGFRCLGNSVPPSESVLGVPVFGTWGIPRNARSKLQVPTRVATHPHG
jgi:hypothetical protein